MDRLVLIRLVCCLGLVMPATAWAQTTTPPPSTTPASTTPADPQAKPTPEPAAPAAADAAEAAPRSLFEQTWRQFQFGGRFSSIDGDPARFQRYGDFRDGVLFTDARYAGEHPEGNYAFHAAVDNLGWRDQRFFGDYEQPGRFVISGCGIRFRSSTASTRKRPTPAPRTSSSCSTMRRNAGSSRARPTCRHTCRSRRSSISGSGATWAG